MPDEPPSILPRGTGTRRPLSPRPALPGSAVYIQSVAGFSCIAGGAIGSADISGGRSPASISATRHSGSSDRREAITAPAEPPPTTIKSNSSDMLSPRPLLVLRPAFSADRSLVDAGCALCPAAATDPLFRGRSRADGLFVATPRDSTSLEAV